MDHGVCVQAHYVQLELETNLELGHNGVPYGIDGIK
jgi:hypothetical protein